MYQGTDALSKIKANQAEFPWGEVVVLHEIGPYAVMEYHSYHTDTSGKIGGVEDDVSFHSYVNGADAGHSWETLEEALAHGMAVNHQGDPACGLYFLRMIGATVRRLSGPDKLSEIKRGGSRLSSGKLVAVHQIGPYAVVEFKPYIVTAKGTTRKTEDASKFQAYTDGQDTSHVFPNLEGALLHAMAVRHEGHSSQAAYYFARMIGIGLYD